jgi:heptosyltransferase-2
MSEPASGTLSPAPSRILAIKLADIGDLLLVTPALSALRRAYPNAALDVLTTPNGANAVRCSSLVDDLLLFDKVPFDSPGQTLRAANWGRLLGFARRLRGRRYDTVLLFHHLSLPFGALKHAALSLATGARRRIGLDNGRGWFLTHRVPDPGFGVKHEVEVWLDLAAAAGVLAEHVHSRRPRIKLTDADTALAAQLLPSGDRPIIALHPGSGGYSPARRWDLDKFVRLGRTLSQQAQVVIVGEPADGTADLAAGLGDDALNLGGRTTVPQLAGVLARCDLLVGADSGVMHVASAAGTRAVALFGPTNHRAWAPALPPNELTIVRSGSACSPCAFTRHGLGTPAGCPERTCMAMISAEQVTAAVEAALASSVRAHDAYEPRTPQNLPPAISVLGVRIHATSYDGLLDWISERVAGGGAEVPGASSRAGRPAHQIATANPEFVMTTRRDSVFRLVLERASLCLPDGVGLFWAARWLNRRRGEKQTPLLHRVTGSDGVPLIAERAAREGWRLFLLGAAPGVAEQTAEVLGSRYPGLQIAGTFAGSPAAEEEEAIVQLIDQSRADILFVAYGAPRQDKWIARNLPRLRVAVAMGVGGAFDYISGRAARAPQWMRRAGLEWLHRLWRQPWRWRRMLALPRFALAVFWDGLAGSRRDLAR